MEFTRVLAVYPFVRRFGFVVLEEPSQLIDWGVRAISRDKNKRCVLLVNGLIDHYKPDVLILEDWKAKGFRRSRRIQGLIAGLIAFAKSKNIKAQTIPRELVIKAFSSFDAVTKYQ